MLQASKLQTISMFLEVTLTFFHMMDLEMCFLKEMKKVSGDRSASGNNSTKALMLPPHYIITTHIFSVSVSAM